jgi:hypothetical protein
MVGSFSASLPGGWCPSVFAIAGKALTAIIAPIRAATARTKIMRLNNIAPPPFSSAATVIVCYCPIVFLHLVEGAR